MPKQKSTQYQTSFPRESARQLYSIIIFLLLPLVALLLIIKSIRSAPGKTKQEIQRFGFYPKPRKKGGVLIHCASVGEVTAAAPVVKSIQKTHPDMTVTVTTMTPTGAEKVKELFSDSVNQVYLPIDLPWFVDRLLYKYQPQKILITEVELWPNLVHCSWRLDIPVFIINARLKDKTRESYQKLSWLIDPMIQKISGVCAQSQRDYDNYQKLSLPPERLHNTGNIKFELSLTSEDQEKMQELRELLLIDSRSVLIAASTHEPEEEFLIASVQQVISENPDFLLVLVPRHPQRFEKVAQICAKSQLKTQKMSDLRPISESTQIVLADQMGILKALLGLGTLAFIGGSIAERGGHNALEAALHRLPIAMGPNTYNNPAICDSLIASGALKIVETEQEMTSFIQFVLENRERAAALGESGYEVISSNSGALERQLEVVGLTVQQVT